MASAKHHCHLHPAGRREKSIEEYTWEDFRGQVWQQHKSFLFVFHCHSHAKLQGGPHARKKRKWFGEQLSVSITDVFIPPCHPVPGFWHQTFSYLQPPGEWLLYPWVAASSHHPFPDPGEYDSLILTSSEFLGLLSTLKTKSFQSRYSPLEILLPGPRKLPNILFSFPLSSWDTELT